MMPTRIYATQLCLLQVPLLAVCFHLALQRLFNARHPCFWIISTLTSFVVYKYDIVTLSAVIALLLFFSHAKTM